MELRYGNLGGGDEERIPGHPDARGVVRRLPLGSVGAPASDFYGNTPRKLPPPDEYLQKEPFGRGGNRLASWESLSLYDGPNGTGKAEKPPRCVHSRPSSQDLTWSLQLGPSFRPLTLASHLGTFSFPI